MKLRKINNKGFSHVELAIVVLVVAVLGLVGYRVLKNTSHAGSNCTGQTLDVGSTGRCVRDAQILVNSYLLYPTNGIDIFDGNFDSVTKSNVNKYQQIAYPTKNSAWTGKITSDTWSKLCSNIPGITDNSTFNAQLDACGKATFTLVKQTPNKLGIYNPVSMVKDNSNNIWVLSADYSGTSNTTGGSDYYISEFNVVSKKLLNSYKLDYKTYGVSVLYGLNIGDDGQLWLMGSKYSYGNSPSTNNYVFNVNPNDGSIKTTFDKNNAYLDDNGYFTSSKLQKSTNGTLWTTYSITTYDTNKNSWNRKNVLLGFAPDGKVYNTELSSTADLKFSVGKNHNLYVSYGSDSQWLNYNNLFVFTDDGGHLLPTNGLTPQIQFEGVNNDTDSNIYGAFTRWNPDKLQFYIQKYNPVNSYYQQLTSSSWNVYNPSSYLVDKTGNMWVSNGGTAFDRGKGAASSIQVDPSMSIISLKDFSLVKNLTNKNLKLGVSISIIQDDAGNIWTLNLPVVSGSIPNNANGYLNELSNSGNLLYSSF